MVASTVAAKCPNCGVRLTVDTDREAATCGSCHITSFVKTYARPVTPDVARQNRSVIDTTRSTTGCLIGFIVVGLLCVGGAIFYVLAPGLRPHSDSPPSPPPPPTPAAVAAPTTAAPSPSPVEVLPTSTPTPTPGIEPAPLEVPSTAKVSFGALTVSGRLSPDIVQRILKQNNVRLRYCYGQALRRVPSLSGLLTVRFIIGRDGSVSNVSNGGAQVLDAALYDCVASVYRSIAFPQPEAGIVTVVAPTLFSR